MSLTGEQFPIAAGGYRATVTEAGAGLRELTFQDQPLILSHGADQTAPAAFGQLLIPWPNRVDHGRYSFDGTAYQLDINEPAYDCAIHGLARWATWAPAEHEADRVRLTHRLLGSPGYPFRLDLDVEYTLDAARGLTVRLTATNSGTRPAPYAHGAHPYLTVGQPIDTCVVRVPADDHLPVDGRMIPYGPPQPVKGTDYDLRDGRLLGDQRIDLAFTGLTRGADGRAWVHLSGENRTTSFWLDRTQPWLEIYTADNVPSTLARQGLGVEPMTSPPNAFATGDDLVRLDPGGTITGCWGIAATA
ncbi:aldose 1-epimerase family protein [Stackebrandtia nassauensis]|uniref:Aldose 1-epimerase n=1 Tax=Stackebrandtia nassauensis (strain DSM 44728 / CIP 108903 / NRRL B-16338 / NBRC 102104 / LLR-40K-21) TaxID=446470 RepID=D3Q9I9_STANL|nr:aldose 1-epimerase family protein [Stackebrandtia nassauensis]ADD42671.1 Aldose 1-epimerase [Stackebrandtia nassauensis DSM 44728]